MQHEERRDYENLFRDRFTPVARTVFLIVHDKQVAEEITQDAFLKLLERWSTVATYERPEAWVRKVAVRMAVRHVGRERSRPLREYLANSRTAVTTDPDPDLTRAVQSLAPMQRAVVVLFYWEDRPVQEIAHTLDIPIGTVMSRLHRARQKLSEQLRDYAKREGVIRN